MKHGWLSLGALALTVGLTGTAAADATLDKIRKGGSTTVATEAAFEPFEFTRDGKIVGYGSDLLVEVAKDLGAKVEQLDIPFQGILAGLEAGQYDFVATTVAINPERARKYGFTRPIGAVENVVVVQARSAIAKPEDLAGKLVASQLGSATEITAKELDAKLKASGAGFSDLRLFQTFPDVMFAVGTGQVDAAVVSSTTAAVFIKSRPNQFKLAGTVGEPRYVAWVTRPADGDLRAAINATIARLAASGELARMQEKWFGFSMPAPAQGYLPEGAVR